MAIILFAAVPGGAQDAAARQHLASTGQLRAALNTNNPLTSAIGAELSRELARRLGVPVAIREYPSPGAVADAASEWDIAFVAADPDREAAMAFTVPYVELDATYLVRADSPIRRVADVDRAGVRIGTGVTSAFTLVLRRELRQAELVPGANDASLKALQEGSLQAVAGLRFNVLQWAKQIPGTRVLEDSFTRAQQAIAVPAGRTEGRQYLNDFLREMKRSGFIATAIEKSGLAGVTVAPES